jgi:hypothetical protein
MKLVTLKVSPEAAQKLKIIAAIDKKKQYEAFEEIINEAFKKIDIGKVKTDDG